MQNSNSYNEGQNRRRYASASRSQTQQWETQARQTPPTQRRNLAQVDDSKVAGRVAYDKDGNLVVVKKEEKKAPVQVAAIVGSALSAVTSAFFSSHIGIGGSILTVAIGAAVSTAGTQLYTHLIQKSTDKLKEVTPGGGQQLAGVMDSSQLDHDGYGYGAQAAQTTQPYGTYATDEFGTTTADGGRIAPQSVIDAADEEHSKQVRRRGIIIVAVMALAAVLIAAAVVTLATGGEGIGTKPAPIIAAQTANENANATTNATTNSTTENAGAASTKQNETPEATSTATNASTQAPTATTATNAASGSSATTQRTENTSSSNASSSAANASNAGSAASSGSANASSSSSANANNSSGSSASNAGTAGTSEEAQSSASPQALEAQSSGAKSAS